MLPNVKRPSPGVRFMGSVALKAGGSKTKHKLSDKTSKYCRTKGQDNSRITVPTNESGSGMECFSFDEDISLENSSRRTTSTPDANKHQSHLSSSRPDQVSSYISFMTTQEKLELRSWGLPESVLTQYKHMGIETMFEWQAECLANEKVLNGKNLVYSAPTSAGKTLVAEILTLKRVLEHKKKAILIFPFVSLAREKMLSLKKLLCDTPHRVGGFMGSHHPPGGFNAVDVAVCTIEKANSLINRMLEEKTLDRLGCIVVDELHLLGDSSRGYLLELLLTKILFMAKRPGGDLRVQIIGMSATLPNLTLLSTWLDAELYTTEFRPVPLSEHIKIGTHVYDSTFNLVREIQPEVRINNDPDHLVYLSLETLLQGFSILVFTPTKNWAEKLAETMSREIFALGLPPRPGGPLEQPGRSKLRENLHRQLDGKQLSEVLEQLKRCPVGLDNSLEKSIRFGVAYHHAGLTMDERDIIETSFKQGILRILVATSTLSSGVNLPARRVIVRSPFTFQNQLLDTLTYRQMIGRAGRKGIDTEGESILLCRDAERKKVEELVKSKLRPVSSCLVQGNGESLCSSMKRAILEVIASGVANTPELVSNYASCTMLSAEIQQASSQQSLESRSNSIKNCVEFLEGNEFIRLQHVEEEDLRYIPTQLGLACLGSSLSPDEGLTVLKELEKARRCFVLENDLHIIYQVVPVSLSAQWPNMDWMNYLSIWESLSPDLKRVGELAGVEERFLVRAMRGTFNLNLPSQLRQLSVHNRFYTALALHDLVNEVPLMAVSKKYNASKGMLQSLQQAASSYAGMVTLFCSKLGWHTMSLIIGQFQDRLQFGVQRELIDLCRLVSLNGPRARVLFAAGIESIAQLANTLPADVENILANSAPFESKKQSENETAADVAKRKEMRTFFVTGKKGLTESEAATLLVEEAREILQNDLGVRVNWSDKNSVSILQASILSSSRTSNSKPNSHQSYLGRYKIKSKARRRVKKSGSSKAVTSSKDPSKSEAQNVSFDVSAQIEEIFQVEALQVQNLSITEADFPRYIKPNIMTAQTCADQSDHHVKEVAPEVFKTPLSKVMSKAPLKKSDCKRRASLDPSPGRFEGSPTKKRNIADKSAKSINESLDVFGDSFADADLENISFVEPAKHVSINKSCPKTPLFEACSEELILEKTGAFEAPEESSDLQHENSVSDSFFERAIETHLSEDSKDDDPVANAFNEDNSVFLFATPSVLKERSSSSDRSKRIQPKTENLKLFTPETPSPKRSQRLQQRRQQQRALLQQHTKISPGLILSSDSENDCNSPNGPKVPPSSQVDEINLVDICANREIFEAFAKEWSKRESFSIALGCSKYEAQVNTGHGGKIIGLQSRKKKTREDVAINDENIFTEDFELSIEGLAISWDKLNAYYISLGDKKLGKNSDDTFGPPTQDPTISTNDRISLIRTNLTKKGARRSIFAFDIRHVYKVLYMSTGIILEEDSGVTQLLDPKVCAWMLQPNDTEKNLHNMVMSFTPELSGVLRTLGSSTGCGSVSMNPSANCSSSARCRAVAEAILTRNIMMKLKGELETLNLWNTFTDVEMPSVISLAKMELNGLGFSVEECEKQRKIIIARLEELEGEAHQLAGRPFSLTSVEDTCQILYRELRLPINGDQSKVGQRFSVPKGKRLRGASVPSTSKEILIKLTEFHKLPKVLLEWRKLNATITKVIGPISRLKTHHPVLCMDRIYPSCQTFTSTGRVALHEPNIQNIPKEFDIKVTNELLEKALGKEEAECLDSSSILMSSLAGLVSGLEQRDKYSVSLRKAFIPSVGCVIIAADYSQLELRIMAHLSKDSQLCHLLSQPEIDVFKSIAATWQKKDVCQVTDADRNAAKQICYGMLYGIGVKALSEQLCVIEEEASAFLSSFKSAYPGVRKFIDDTIVECRKRGFIVTLGGRRRYLPNINLSEGGFARGAAERQAINSTVQGSAADLVKRAMVDIDRRLERAFPSCKKPIRFQKNSSTPYCHSGGYLLLQLHDELIYEVVQEDVVKVKDIIRQGMEGAVKLLVPTPVRIKIGTSWGDLHDMLV